MDIASETLGSVGRAARYWLTTQSAGRTARAWSEKATLGTVAGGGAAASRRRHEVGRDIARTQWWDAVAEPPISHPERRPRATCLSRLLHDAQRTPQSIHDRIQDNEDWAALAGNTRIVHILAVHLEHARE